MEMVYSEIQLREVCQRIKEKYHLNENRWYISYGPHLGDCIRILREIMPFLPKKIEVVVHIEVDRDMVSKLSEVLGCQVIYDVDACRQLNRIALKLFRKYSALTFLDAEDTIVFRNICSEYYIIPGRIRCPFFERRRIMKDWLEKCFETEIPETEEIWKFPKVNIDQSYYINKYGIVPGNTVWICPEARCEGAIAPEYWNLSASLYRTLGYTVVFNVTNFDTIHSYDGKIVSPPVVECIEFANLCGNVLSLRSGLCDLLCDSTAKMVVVYHSAVSRAQAKSGFTNSIFGNNANITLLVFFQSSFRLGLDSILKNKIRNIQISNEYVIDSLIDSDLFYPSKIKFIVLNEWGREKRTDEHLFDISYLSKLENTRYYTYIKLPEDSENFLITYELRDDYGVLETIRDVYLPKVEFFIAGFGNIYIRVKVHWLSEEKFCQFDTDVIKFFPHTYKQYLSPENPGYKNFFLLTEQFTNEDDRFRNAQFILMTQLLNPDLCRSFWEHIIQYNIFLYASPKENPLLRLLFLYAPAIEHLEHRLLAYEDFSFECSNRIKYSFTKTNFRKNFFSENSSFLLIGTERNPVVAERLNKITDNVTEFADFLPDSETSYSDFHLENTTDFEQYILQLHKLKENLVIFISGKDAFTPSKVNESQNKLRILKLLGLPELSYKYRYSYIAIIDSGSLVIDEISENGKLSVNYGFADNSCTVESEGYNVKRSPNCSGSITINGREYSQNVRGLNDVVFDKTINSVIDSVAFDSFRHSALIVRKSRG
ncbi:MAG: hypothetical protein LBB94_05725 [Clostridiales bacterium]|jgi:hypothetical protein|nr:hypothetical protein [Clostridiales bacterium]